MPKTTKILIIEPKVEFRSRLADELDLSGYQVAQARNPELARPLVEANGFDLIVARVDGLCDRCLLFLEEIRRLQPPETLYIILADEISSANAVNALRFGAADLLSGAANVAQVVASVRMALAPTIERKRARQLFCCLSVEERSFTFPSAEESLGPAVDLLTENLTRAGICSQVESRLVAMALAEGLTNALYHGNLEIDPRLKLEEDHDRFATLVRERMADPRFARRKLTVRSVLTPEEAVFYIRDDGPGFAGRRSLEETRCPERDRHKGRGLYLLSSIMDDLMFNDTGNEIRMVKRATRPFAGIPLLNV
ncbi:MAG: ATP-binding protein [Nitrospinae bacterium]|nr:ATP-binding protein [Nitrospinota bacterium]